MTCPLTDFQVPQNFARHPGGQYVLETARQSKCPGLLFLAYHMGSDLNGKVAPAARALGIAMPLQGKMFAEMHEAFRKVRETHPEQRTYFLVYCMILTVLLPSVWLWFLAKPSITLGILMGTLFALYFLNVFHTRHHRGGELYKNKFLSRLTTPLYEFVDSTWGYIPGGWRWNHHVGHHVYTNDTGPDNVMPAFYPLLRTCYDTPKLWFHRFQTFYFPLLLSGTGFNFPIMNILIHNGRVWHFSAWILLTFVLPVWLHGRNYLMHAMVPSVWGGVVLSYLFAVSHTHESLESSTAGAESYCDIDEWLKLQIKESISYGGYVFTFLFGGINMQIEHHLCPTLDPPLYALVAPDIARICQKYGVKYMAEPSFCHAVYQFHWQLWKMGRSSKGCPLQQKLNDCS